MSFCPDSIRSLFRSVRPPHPTASTALTSCIPLSALPLRSQHSGGKHNVLSAGVPLPLLGPVCPLFSLSAELPRNGHDAGHDDTSDQGVAAPVGRLRVPTTGWGPDVLGVTIAGLQVRYGGRFAFGASVREVKLTGLFRRRPVVNCQRSSLQFRNSHLPF